MNLNVWEEETFEILLNSGMFQITDCGPMCSPINSFEIKRDDKHRLLLTTHSDGNSRKDTRKFPELPAGSVHSYIASVTLSGSDMTVVANGVWPFSQTRRSNPITKAYEATEIAWVGSIEASPEDVEAGHIQLLKNIFNRIIISMTGASNQYIDCFSPSFPIRQLVESVEATDRFFFEVKTGTLTNF